MMQPPSVPQELHYRMGSPAPGHFPGSHRSTRGEGGFELRGHAPLLDVPDARRLDLHASLRDPFGQWVVRVYSQRKAIQVVLVADLSASMGFAATRRKLDVMADLVDSLAWSAWRQGDSFGFIGCDGEVREDLLQPPTRVRGVGAALAGRLRALDLQGTSADALALAAVHLGRQRSLVFLVSDFHLPLPRVEAVLASLAHHELVPVVLWDPVEFDLHARSGLVRVRDPEGGAPRLVWWRPSLREKWQAARDARRAALLQVFEKYRRRAHFIEGAYDADALTRHFHT